MDSLPDDDYALSILTQAAMQSNNQDTRALSLQQAEASTTTTSISNHSNDNLQHPQSQSPLLNSFVPSLRSMETLSFNPGLMRQHPYMSSGFPDVASHMPQNFTNNLGILNAESFDDAYSRGRDSKMRNSHDQLLPFGIADNPELRMDLEMKASSDDYEKGSKKRRKHKIDTQNDDEEEEARKKARGRPRVDTKDETAADRRRTQIRMAQRAYRHRKETTITSLEKQVQDLRGTNEEMSNIFISLYDFAVDQGLLQREPEFGQQLQSTTERFLALAKSTAQDEGSQDEQHEESVKQIEPEPARRTRATRTSKKVQEQSPRTSDAPIQPYGGYISRLSPSNSPEEETPLDTQLQTYEHRPRATALQVITQPTEDNASFPFDLMDLQQYRVDVPPMEDYSQNFLLQTQLPLPTTHAYGESSFARRIQRASVERAWRLITAKNPPEKRFKEVFGLTLMYETKEALIARLGKFLKATDKEPLSEWCNPFVHIGGSGTFYPNHDSEIEVDLMPKFRTGYSMGPFNSAVGQAQELMQDDMRCTLPGFEGEFFDAHDVDGYLRVRGLDIPASADYITAELDASILSEALSPRSDSVDTLLTVPSSETRKSPAGRITINSSVASNYDFNKPGSQGFPFPITLWSDEPTKDAGNIDPIFNTLQTQNPTYESPQSVPSDRSLPNKRRVTININVLIESILDHSACLGRATGFRLSDVNAAIVAAVKAGF